ncbi:MAG: hypothetical protein N2316_08175 [Spirochaetes bacterium]|nr:hypothetical protein [Spirochaetota bacterium]
MKRLLHTKSAYVLLGVFFSTFLFFLASCEDDFHATINEENQFIQTNPNSSSDDNSSSAALLLPGNNGVILATLHPSGDIHLQWSRAHDSEWDYSKLRYCIYYSKTPNISSVEGAESFGNPVGNCQEDITSITINDLEDGTQYYFNVIVATPDSRKAAYSMTSLLIPGTVYLYATVKTFQGNMVQFGASARSALDSYCNPSHNQIPSHIEIRHYHAFISITESDAIINFPALFNVPTTWAVKSTSGITVAYNWYDLLDGSINTKLEAAGISDTFWWSGSFADGKCDPANNCQSWTNGTNKAAGIAGAHNAIDESWVSSNNRNCNNALKVLCIGW